MPFTLKPGAVDLVLEFLITFFYIFICLFIYIYYDEQNSSLPSPFIQTLVTNLSL